jgi:hypothetical protein
VTAIWQALSGFGAGESRRVSAPIAREGGLSSTPPRPQISRDSSDYRIPAFAGYDT